MMRGYNSGTIIDSISDDFLITSGETTLIAGTPGAGKKLLSRSIVWNNQSCNISSTSLDYLASAKYFTNDIYFLNIDVPYTRVKDVISIIEKIGSFGKTLILTATVRIDFGHNFGQSMLDRFLSSTIYLSKEEKSAGYVARHLKNRYGVKRSVDYYMGGLSQETFRIIDPQSKKMDDLICR